LGCGDFGFGFGVSGFGFQIWGFIIRVLGFVERSDDLQVSCMSGLLGRMAGWEDLVESYGGRESESVRESKRERARERDRTMSGMPSSTNPQALSGLSLSN
jgi:hypothetical protein